MLLILALTFLAAAGYLASEVATMPERERRSSVRRAATYGSVRLASSRDREAFRERILTPMNGKLAIFVLRLNPRTTVESVNAKLMSAGLGRSITPTGFLAGKALLAGGGLLFGFTMGGSSGLGSGVIFGVVFGVLGFLVPDLLVTMKARSRKEDLRAELPDALDLLAVSVEAGMGFDGAITKLTEHMEGSLAEEFSLALGEMRIGESRSDALKKMGERTDTPEVQNFVRSIIQADQLGISLGRILRVQATDTRLRRQSAAEERAMKAPIKMLFPTVAFIFPAMFLVILGPAFLNLGKLFAF